MEERRHVNRDGKRLEHGVRWLGILRHTRGQLLFALDTRAVLDRYRRALAAAVRTAVPRAPNLDLVPLRRGPGAMPRG